MKKKKISYALILSSAGFLEGVTSSNMSPRDLAIHVSLFFFFFYINVYITSNILIENTQNPSTLKKFPLLVVKTRTSYRLTSICVRVMKTQSKSLDFVPSSICEPVIAPIRQQALKLLPSSIGRGKPMEEQPSVAFHNFMELM